MKPASARLMSVAEGTDLMAIAKVSVDNTTNGKTLAQLLGAALAKEIKRITLVPDGVVYWALGNASTTGPQLPSGGISVSLTKATADLLKFRVASTSINMLVVQEG